MCGDILVVKSGVTLLASGGYEPEVANCPTMNTTDPITKNYWAQTANGAMVEKPCIEVNQPEAIRIIQITVNL